MRRPTDALGDQFAVTLTRIPAHSDSQQSAGHHHQEIAERYVVTRGTLMRFGDAIETVRAPAAARVAPGTSHSHRGCCSGSSGLL